MLADPDEHSTQELKVLAYEQEVWVTPLTPNNPHNPNPLNPNPLKKKQMITS